MNLRRPLGFRPRAHALDDEYYADPPVLGLVAQLTVGPPPTEEALPPIPVHHHPPGVSVDMGCPGCLEQERLLGLMKAIPFAPEESRLEFKRPWPEHDLTVPHEPGTYTLLCFRCRLGEAAAVFEEWERDGR